MLDKVEMRKRIIILTEVLEETGDYLMQHSVVMRGLNDDNEVEALRESIMLNYIMGMRESLLIVGFILEKSDFEIVKQCEEIDSTVKEVLGGLAIKNLSRNGGI